MKIHQCKHSHIRPLSVMVLLAVELGQSAVSTGGRCVCTNTQHLRTCVDMHVYMYVRMYVQYITVLCSTQVWTYTHTIPGSGYLISLSHMLCISSGTQMYVCTHAYMYVRMYTLIHVRMYTRIHVRMYVSDDALVLFDTLYDHT